MCAAVVPFSGEINVLFLFLADTTVPTVITLTRLSPGHNRAVCANKPFKDESLQTNSRCMQLSWRVRLVIVSFCFVFLHDLSSLSKKKGNQKKKKKAQKCSSLQNVNHRHEILDESLWGGEWLIIQPAVRLMGLFKHLKWTWSELVDLRHESSAGWAVNFRASQSLTYTLPLHQQQRAESHSALPPPLLLLLLLLVRKETLIK